MSEARARGLVGKSKPDIEAVKANYLSVFVEHGHRIACERSDIASSLPTYWRKHDPDFARAASEASEFTAQRLEARVDDAIEGRIEMTNVQAQLVKWRLAALKPLAYRERVSLEQSGPGGGPIKIDGDAGRGMSLLDRWKSDRCFDD